MQALGSYHSSSDEACLSSSDEEDERAGKRLKTEQQQQQQQQQQDVQPATSGRIPAWGRKRLQELKEPEEWEPPRMC
jgi:hypothetical protein